MFGMGMPEIILILAIALVVIGPKKLPDLAKALGRAMGEFKRATSDFKQTLDVDNNIKDVKQAFDGLDTTGKDAYDPEPGDGENNAKPQQAADTRAPGPAPAEGRRDKDPS